MKIHEIISENIKLSEKKLSNENSNGQPIAYNEQALQNFWNWFNGSKVIDDSGRPMVMYHGTSADFAKFSYEYADKGSSAYGMGFYFTNMPHTASGYAGGDNPNVMATYLNIKKPMPSDYSKLLNRAQIKKIILSSPIFDEALSNYGDVSYVGKSAVLNEAIDAFDNCCDTLLTQLNYIANDFYSGENKAFLNAIRTISGFDGVKHIFENGETFFIAWNNGQIKSSTGNRGQYSTTDIMTDSID